jgi:hypothetical protein
MSDVRFLEHLDGREVLLLERFAQLVLVEAGRLGKIEVNLLFGDDRIDALLVYPRQTRQGLAGPLGSGARSDHAGDVQGDL